MIIGIGELAAFATAVSWGISSQVHGVVGRMVGPVGITLLRMPYQVFFLGVMCLVLQAQPSMTLAALGYLAISALFGLFISDYLLYRAIYIVGPAMGVLLQSSSTIFAALLGWLILGESLPWPVVGGIAVAMLGILTVITEHSGSTLLPGQEKPEGKLLLLGAGFGLGCAASLAMSFILLKQGLQTGLDPLWATFVRLAIGSSMLWGLGSLRGWPAAALRGVREHPKVCWMLLFSCAFSALGLWCSSLALKLAPVGVAATLIGLQPITVTLIGAVWYRRLPSLRIILGSLIAFGGIALICLN